MSKKLAIVTTHPIQYYVPIFQRLSKLVDLKVYYTWGIEGIKKFDPGFGRVIEWDIPILEGYPYQFEVNISKNPGSHHFRGIQNPYLIKQIKDFQPDAILIFGWAYESHLKVMRHFKGRIPIWFRGDSTTLNQNNGLKSRLRKFFLHWVYSHADHAFYVGKANHTYFRKMGIPANKLSFAPHAIDMQRFSEKKSLEVLELRKSFDINSRDILILFAGKLETVKNPLLLLKAFQKINSPKIHLLFVGNGELEKKLKEASTPLSLTKDSTLPMKNRDKLLSPTLDENDDLGVKNRVHFMDFQNQSQMPVVYQSCDIFCLPSYSETWGLAVNEAMAAGKAVLVSDKVGCASDLIKTGENGFVFESGNLQDLIQKLELLCENPSALISYGKCSLEIIKNYTFEHIVQAIEAQFIGTNEGPH